MIIQLGNTFVEKNPFSELYVFNQNTIIFEDKGANAKKFADFLNLNKTAI